MAVSSSSSAMPGAQQLGLAEQVDEPEADDRAARAHQVRVANLVGIPDAIPKVTRRPNGASASRQASNAAPPHISRTTSTGSPLVRVEDRRLQVLGAGVDRRVGAQPLQASSRFASLDAMPITRPAPMRLASCTASEPVPPAAAWTTTDSPCCEPGRGPQQARAVRPWSSSAGRLLVGDRVGHRDQRPPREPRPARRSRRWERRRHPAAPGIAARHLAAGDQRQGLLGQIVVADRVRVGEVDAGARNLDHDLARRPARDRAGRRAASARARRTR